MSPANTTHRPGITQNFSLTSTGFFPRCVLWMWAKQRDSVAGVARSGQDWMMAEGSEAPLSMASTWVGGVQSDRGVMKEGITAGRWD